MGGGGGGNPSLTPDEVEILEKKAKETFKKAEANTRSNIFISFVAEDINDVNLLRGQAKNENSNIEFNDYSLKEPYNSQKADYIKRGIRERIRQSSVVIVYLSAQTAGSKWVDWEIRESHAMGKKVLAMHKGNTPPTSLPKAVTELKIPVISWNQKELARAIKKKD